MLLSMTGYGNASLQIEDRSFEVQIKALNSKNTDISTRLPSCFQDKDLKIRRLLSERLKRGKIDFSITIDGFSIEGSSVIQVDIVKDYMDQLKEIVNCSELDLLRLAVEMPNVIQGKAHGGSEIEYSKIENLIEDAIKALQEFRAREGSVLTADFKKYVETIKTLLNNIEVLDPIRIEKTKSRLEALLTEVRENLDINRLEQELLYYSDRLDISEEKVRLAEHLDFFVNTVEDKEISKGKKLGFIAQEMGREINTIGSKCNDVKIQKIVVQMKEYLEKIKEQIFNVL